MRPFLAVVMICLMAGCLPEAVGAQRDESGPPVESGVFEVGYSASLISGVDLNDARAAMRLWVERLIENVGEEAGSETVILDDLASLKAALERKRVDLVLLQSLEYLEVRDRLPLVPLVVPSLEGRVEEKYVLLSRSFPCSSGSTTFALFPKRISTRWPS